MIWTLDLKTLKRSVFGTWGDACPRYSKEPSRAGLHLPLLGFLSELLTALVPYQQVTDSVAR